MHQSVFQLGQDEARKHGRLHASGQTDDLTNALSDGTPHVIGP